MEYRKFYLTPGQQSPEGNTGQGMSDGSIVWVGKEGTFPKVATTDPNEPGVSKIYISHVMSEKELEEYNLLLKYQEEVKDGFENIITFDDYKDPTTFAAKKTEIKSKIDTIERKAIK